ncbi:MAG: DNA-binding transcriptional ArsR family regulator [Cognaticolwellia sp.]|jgi:DNA-binding transcriptional ArsR family regulator
MGKSHLLALTKQALEPLAQGARVVVLPEDVPLYGSAQELLEALARSLQPKVWDSWKRAAVDLSSLHGAVVLFEGLDRQLDALREPERQAFRDLSPQGQSVLALLCEAPRKLSPKEIAEILGQDTRSIATACRRLSDHGLLEVEQEGRRSWYSVAEPLFRFWHEYRTGPWEQTRVALLGRLLEAVATPEELVSGWMLTKDEGMRKAFEVVMVRNQAASIQGWDRIVDAVAELKDSQGFPALLERASVLPARKSSTCEI